MSVTKLDVNAFREQIKSNGGLQLHIKYGRTGSVSARLWHHDAIVLARASGGGYDKVGTVIGECVQILLQPELALLPLPTKRPDGSNKGFYGLFAANNSSKRLIDGACGLDAVLAILKACGFGSVRLLSTGKNSDMLLATREAKS